jgi:hypothetical protein
MASPQVCGAAGLVRNANQSLNAQETKAILLATTENIATQNPALTRQAYGQGYLRDDRAVALATTVGAAFTRVLSATGTPQTHAIGVTANQNYRVVLCWPRRLGTSNSTAWSNLALRVLNGATVVVSSDDARMLYEAVTFTAPSTGTYNIEVSATSLEGGLPIEYSIAHTATPVGYVGGAFTTFGSGCNGTAGLPLIGSRGVPTIGGYWGVTLSNARASTGALLAIGASNTTWGAVPLPFAIPGAPGCAVNVSIDVPLSTNTNAAGRTAVYFRLTAQPYFIGASIYMQWFVVDAGANAANLVSTQGARAVVGGMP